MPPDDAFAPAMKAAAFALLLGACSSAVLAASETRIASNAAAIEAAKRYLRGRCTVETPCKFKAEHEGRQWRVWVQLTRRDSPSAAPRPFPGGTVILYLGEDGSLKRRLEAD